MIKVDLSKVARFGSGLDWIIGLAGGALLAYLLYQVVSTWMNGSSFQFKNGLEAISVIIPLSIGLYFLVGSFLHLPYPFTFNKKKVHQAEAVFDAEKQTLYFKAAFDKKTIPFHEIEGFKVVTQVSTYTQGGQIEMAVTDLDKKIAGGTLQKTRATKSTLIQYRIESYPVAHTFYTDMSKSYCEKRCLELNEALKATSNKT